MSKIAPYMKALIGALIAGLASLQQSLDDGAVTAQEWTGIAIATLSGLALVWAIPNKDPEARHQDESVQPSAHPTHDENGQRILGKALAPDLRKLPKDKGATDVLYLLVVVLVVLVILALVGVL